MRAPRKAALIAICLLVIVLLVVVFAGLREFTAVRRQREAAAALRGIAMGLDVYATDNSDTYPEGYGNLIWKGLISPKMVVSATDPHADELLVELTNHDWEWNAASPAFSEMNQFAADHASYVVTVWSQQRVDEKERIVAYQKLKRGSEHALVAYQLGGSDTIPQVEAIKSLREAGHEPVWAD